MKQIKWLGTIAALILSVACASAQTTNAPTTNTPTIVPISQTIVNNGNWSIGLSLRGVANITTPASTANNSTYGGELEFGRALKIGLPGYISIRQDFSYIEINSTTLEKIKVKPVAPSTTPTTKKVVEKTSTSGVQFGTKLAYDWQLFRIGNWSVDAGANAGAYYGNQTLDWQVSPEVDTRLFLTKNSNVFGRVEYPFDLNSGQFTGGLVYSIGYQWRF